MPMAPTGGARLLHVTKQPHFILDVTLTHPTGEPLPLSYFEPAAAEDDIDDAPPASEAQTATAGAEAAAASDSNAEQDTSDLHAGIGDDDSFVGLHRLLQNADNLERLATVGEHIKVRECRGYALSCMCFYLFLGHNNG